MYATHSRILAWRTPMDRGAWRATVHGSQSRTRQSDGAQHIYDLSFPPFFNVFMFLLFPKPLAPPSVNRPKLWEKLSLIQGPGRGPSTWTSGQDPGRGPSTWTSIQPARWPCFRAGKMGRASPREDERRWC